MIFVFTHSITNSFFIIRQNHKYYPVLKLNLYEAKYVILYCDPNVIKESNEELLVHFWRLWYQCE